MYKSNKKIYITGLDGTLLANNSRLPKSTRHKIIKILKNDINFTIATARSISSIQEILTGISLKLPVVETNGSFVTELVSGQRIIKNIIEKELNKEIITFLRNNGFIPFMTCIENDCDYINYECIINDGMYYFYNQILLNNKTPIYKVTKLENCLNDRIISYIVLEKKDILVQLKENLINQFGNRIYLHIMQNPLIPELFALYIYNGSVNKGYGINSFLIEFGLQDHEIIAFGDDLNDIEMFEIASKSIAVDNANILLKNVATEVIGKKDSVIDYIINDCGIDT